MTEVIKSTHYTVEAYRSRYSFVLLTWDPIKFFSMNIFFFYFCKILYKNIPITKYIIEFKYYVYLNH